MVKPPRHFSDDSLPKSSQVASGLRHTRAYLRSEWCPHQESNLEPRPLESAYACFITPCGHQTGSPGWIRTITAALTERHPTVRSPRILKWWTRTVTLRLLLGANQPCSLLHYEPFETGGPCGLCSRYLSLDRRVLWLIELTDLELDAGLGSHQPRRAYETCQSTGSSCDLKKWFGLTVMLRAGW